MTPTIYSTVSYLPPLHTEGRRREALADYEDRCAAARERFEADIAEADRIYHETCEEIWRDTHPEGRP